MSAPASSTYNGWWDDRENGQYDLYYRGTLIGSMTATGLVMVIPTAAIGYGTGAGGAVGGWISGITSVGVSDTCSGTSCSAISVSRLSDCSMASVHWLASSMGFCSV